MIQLRNIVPVFAIFTVFGLLLFAYKYLDFLTRENPIAWYIPFLEEMTGAYALALTVPLVVRITRRFRPSLRSWWPWLPAHAAAVVFTGFLQTSLIYVIRLAVFAALGLGQYDYGILWIRYFMELPVEFLCYCSIAGVTLFLDAQEKQRRREIRFAELEKELAQAQLEKLRLQLQPHFLFNTLNMISSIVYESPAKADEMLCRLSEYLRDALARNPAQEVRLAEEIRVTRAYLDIMQARFEDGLQVRWEIEPGLENAVVPQLLLQPLAENAFHHGVDPGANAVAISIAASRDGTDLCIEVRNSGRRGNTASTAGLGLGLGNTRQRLNRLYGAEGSVDLSTADSGGTLVTLRFPFRLAEGL